MKPKAPKKKDPKPQAKSGEVRYGGYQDAIMNSNPFVFESLCSQLEFIKAIKTYYIKL